MTSRTTVAALLLLALVPAIGVAAGDEWKASLEDADAVYHEIREEYTLHRDGAIEHRHVHRLRYLTPYAFSRILGETFVVYDPTAQDLEIRKSETTMPEGTRVPATPNAFNEVLPGFCASAPPYMHLREMVITHLGLDDGSVAHLDYAIRSEPGFFPWLMGEEVFSDHHPVEEKTVVVRVPEGTDLRYRLENHPPIEPRVEGENGFKAYVWTLKHLPMVPPEAMAQDLSDHAPRLVFSTCSSWEEIAGLLRQRLERAAVLGDEARAKARELRRGAGSDEEFVRAVHRFVAREVATADVDARLVGYAPIGADEVFRTAVGSPLDKAVLLVAMLRSEGFEAEPVLVSRRDDASVELPSLLAFDEFRVSCRGPEADPDERLFEHEVLMDPRRLAHGMFDDDLAGHLALRPSRTSDPVGTIPEGVANGVRVDLRLELDDEHRLGGDLSIEVAGASNPYLDLREDSGGWGQARLASLLPGAEISEVRPTLLSEERSVFKGTTAKPAALETGEGHPFLLFDVPDAPGGLAGLHIPIAPAARKTPIRLPRIGAEEVDVEIALPDGVEVVALPKARSIRNSAGRLEALAEVRDGAVRLRRRLTLTSRQVPPEAYPGLRELFVAWNDSGARRVVFRLSEQAGER